ncbi:MAG: hypothetical protein NVV74_16950 [Magnetospirillum sp.]|nr:hypothetical protein [Magnetospirillum sp.]
MTFALFLHLLCVATWLGCILVEALYEHSIDDSPAMRRFISALHWKTDKFIEIPAFLGVLLTGGAMLHQAPYTPLLWTKIGLGLTAITFNAVCVWLVVKRLALADKGDFAGWEKLDHWQHKLGAVVLLALLAALVAGGALFVAR